LENDHPTLTRRIGSQVEQEQEKQQHRWKIQDELQQGHEEENSNSIKNSSAIVTPIPLSRYLGWRDE
jgi:predicted Holliday junction resolvase-like endonuclease